MRLNADYVRNILLYIEQKLDYEDTQLNSLYKHKEITDEDVVSDKYFENYNKEELAYALELLIKEKYIDLASEPKIRNGNLVMARIIGLTWKGHELLDNIRDNTVWNTVKRKQLNLEDYL